MIMKNYVAPVRRVELCLFNIYMKSFWTLKKKIPYKLTYISVN